MFDYNNLFYFQNNSVEKIDLTLMNLVEVSSKSGVYLLLGFVFGNILNRILPAYVETKEKRDYVIEVFLTGALMGLLTFLSVKLLEYGVYNLVGKTELSGSSVFSVLMLIPMFSVQSDLKKKLTHILTGQKQINDPFVASVTDDDYDSEDDEINNALDQQLIVQNNQPAGPVGPNGLNENTLPQSVNQNRANGGNMNTMNNNTQRGGGCNCGMNSCNGCNSNTSIDSMTTKYNNNNNNNNFNNNNNNNNNFNNNNNNNNNNFQMNPEGFSHFDRSDNENNNSRINGYCASSDQVCSGQWTDSKVSNEMNLNSFAGSSGGWGAPLI